MFLEKVTRIIFLLAIGLSSIKASGQKFDPEKYKIDRMMQQSRDLQRESERNRINEERRRQENMKNAERSKSATNDRYSEEPRRKTTSNNSDANNYPEYKGPYNATHPHPPFQELPLFVAPKMRPTLIPKLGKTPLDGLSKYRFPNGDSFVGRWAQHIMDSGTYYFANGDYFIGKFANNKMLLSNASYYFKAGGHLRFYLQIPSGFPKEYLYFQSNPRITWGVNKDNMAQSVSLIFKNGDYFDGGYLNGNMEGHCQYQWNNGRNYWVEFKNGIEQSFKAFD